jgi:hypothetical protein
MFSDIKSCLCLVSVLYLTFVAKIQASQVDHSAIKIAPKIQQKELSPLTGYWVRNYWRLDHKEAEFQEERYPIKTYKLYTDNRFVYFEILPNGELRRSYGGTYIKKDKTSIVETIEFYSPYYTRGQIYATKGKITLFSGESMVGAKIHLTIKIEGDQMWQTGIIKQNSDHLNDADLFTDIFFSAGFKKQK